MTTTVWLLIAFGMSMVMALLLTPAVIKAAAALRLLDAPDGGRRVHHEPVPRLGGIAVYLAAAAIACVVFVRASPLFVTPGVVGDEQIRFLAGAFLGSAILFLTGLVDDVRGLSAGAKGVAQVSAALVAWYFGARLDSVALGYGEGVSLGLFGVAIVVFWIVGVTNAFNFIDGLNGLAGGLAIVALAAFFIAALALGNFVILVPAAALGGALFGFLRFNFPRANIFLGDSGSMSIGFLLAVLSLEASKSAGGAMLVAVPLLALSVPLLDGSLAIIRRWLRHLPVSGADARHIHHRIQALGISASRTAAILWGLAVVMAGFGLLLALTAPFVASSIAILGLVAVAVMLIYGTNLLAYNELIVAGEVLFTAPARVRRVISDQIRALDLIATLNHAETVDDVATVLSDGASQFGFLGMELIGERVMGEKVADRILPSNWSWRLDYPVGPGPEGPGTGYVLSIWCSPDMGGRPYGAERIARVLGPALYQWFEARENREDGVAAIELVPASSGRLVSRIGPRKLAREPRL